MITQVSLPTLQQGTSGAAVEILQRFLVIYGYEKYLGTKPVDGQFGLKTKAAVQAFQGDHYLVKDGIVSALTWKAMAFPFDNPNNL